MVMAKDAVSSAEAFKPILPVRIITLPSQKAMLICSMEAGCLSWAQLEVLQQRVLAILFQKFIS